MSGMNGKRLAEIYLEIDRLENKCDHIVATYTAKIWGDNADIKEIGYSPMSNQAEKYRQSQLTIQLYSDKEYQDSLAIISKLKAERIEMGVDNSLLDLSLYN